MTSFNRWNFHNSGLLFSATLTGSLERLKDNPASEADRTIIDSAVKITPPIEMLNDEKERHRYATVASIYMAWTLVPTGAPRERDRIVFDGNDFRIRKVKAWPSISNPAFYELHLEDES